MLTNSLSLDHSRTTLRSSSRLVGVRSSHLRNASRSISLPWWRWRRNLRCYPRRWTSLPDSHAERFSFNLAKSELLPLHYLLSLLCQCWYFLRPCSSSRKILHVVSELPKPMQSRSNLTSFSKIRIGTTSSTNVFLLPSSPRSVRRPIRAISTPSSLRNNRLSLPFIRLWALKIRANSLVSRMFLSPFALVCSNSVADSLSLFLAGPQTGLSKDLKLSTSSPFLSLNEIYQRLYNFI